MPSELPPANVPPPSRGLPQREPPDLYPPQMFPPDAQPDVVAHADWSVRPVHRQVAWAIRTAGGYRLTEAPYPVANPAALLTELRRQAPHPATARVLLGVDFALGVPVHYAQRAGLASFADLLARLGTPDWSDFARPAAAPQEITVRRPFYPAGRHTPQGQHCRAAHLLGALGAANLNDLRRLCDRGYPAGPHGPARRAAAPLFWTVGPQQVGKAALAGWFDLIGPARGMPSLSDQGLASRGSDAPLRLWPFDGPLGDMLAAGPVTVLAEAYPTEYYGPLGLRPAQLATRKAPVRTAAVPIGHAKSCQAVRRAAAGPLLEAARHVALAVAQPVRLLMADGCGAAPSAPDAFDALVGLVGMLSVVRGHRPIGEPPTLGPQRVIEGNILGQFAHLANQAASICNGTMGTCRLA